MLYCCKKLKVQQNTRKVKRKCDSIRDHFYICNVFLLPKAPKEFEVETDIHIEKAFLYALVLTQ